MQFFRFEETLVSAHLHKDGNKDEEEGTEEQWMLDVEEKFRELGQGGGDESRWT